MHIENMPFCCTSAILGSFGEHGEPSVVSVAEIKRMIASKLQPVFNRQTGECLDAGKRCVFAISIDPGNVKMLKAAGFQEIDAYEGIQGTVHILTFHAYKGMEKEGSV